MTPYSRLPGHAFWRTAVAERNMFDISDLWQPKRRITRAQGIATYGSCFAQHIGRALRQNGFRWMDAEIAPAGLSAENAKRFNYGIFSSRTENIYTATMLAQWVDWALGHAPVPDEVWEENGRFYDPFRPRVKPEGFASADEMRAARAWTLECFRRSFVEAEVFVFTLGLTERWVNAQLGYEYAMCPGTAAGRFDPEAHRFDNLQVAQVLAAMNQAMSRMREVNGNLKFLLTVSPVPLTATNSGKHVLVATMESKSILRTVAGQLAANRGFIDYFPSYEIINATPFRGTFFEPNQRSVNPAGVAFVMRAFFEAMGIEGGGVPVVASASAAPVEPDEVVCQEELLDAFAKP